LAAAGTFGATSVLALGAAFAAGFTSTTFATAAFGAAAFGAATLTGAVAGAGFFDGAAFVAPAFNGAWDLGGADLDAGVGSSINLAGSAAFGAAGGGVAATGEAGTAFGGTTSLGARSLDFTEPSCVSHHHNMAMISTALMITGK
jgi:hypothetical protein